MLLPVTLMLLGPVAVVTTLFYDRNVWLTFLVYHLGICLVAPYVANRARGSTWRRHLQAVGLTGERGRPPAGWVAAGALLGAACALAILGLFAIWNEAMLVNESAWATLRGWGVTRDSLPALYLVMLAGNGAAEELFWRGWLHGRLAALRPRAAAISLVAICYASYHAFTVASLLRSAPVTLLSTVVVFAAGCFWGWLRERSGSVWPSLLCHTGATAGYMAVLWRWVIN